MSTGRYIVVDEATGRKFWIEPISARDEKSTDRVFTNGGYDGESVKNKSQSLGGSVYEEDSKLTLENGFTHVTTLSPGASPHSYIEYLCRTGKRVGE
jgi:hypothetical protein